MCQCLTHTYSCIHTATVTDTGEQDALISGDKVSVSCGFEDEYKCGYHTRHEMSTVKWVVDDTYGNMTSKNSKYSPGKFVL